VELSNQFTNIIVGFILTLFSLTHTLDRVALQDSETVIVVGAAAAAAFGIGQAVGARGEDRQAAGDGQGVVRA
jgi:hypothetical protein